MGEVDCGFGDRVSIKICSGINSKFSRKLAEPIQTGVSVVIPIRIEGDSLAFMSNSMCINISLSLQRRLMFVWRR